VDVDDGGRRARYEARVAAGSVVVDAEDGVWWFDLKFSEGCFEAAFQAPAPVSTIVTSVGTRYGGIRDLFGGHCWRSWWPRSVPAVSESVSSSYLAHISS